MALQQSHFTFHRDFVLGVQVVALESILFSKKCDNAQSNNSIKYVKAGAKLLKYTKKLHSQLLQLTTASKLLSDVKDNLVFSLFIAKTHLQPDSIVLYFH